ncbi:MAG TPA: agmatinase [bacterium]|nr:agmatinase [bacterium]
MEQSSHQFMGEFCDYQSAKIVIIPVPLERSTSYLAGTAGGPAAIIEASQNVELYDIELNSEPFRQGIHTLDPIFFAENDSVAAAFEKIEKCVNQTLKDQKFPVILGGEHALSFPSYLAFHNSFTNLSVLHIDAHADLRNEYLGDRYSHACVMRRIHEKNQDIVSIGIRSMCAEEAEFIDTEKPVIYFDHEIYQTGLPVRKILSQISQNVYITFDLDGVNPVELPSVGTPEPGGLGWYQLVSLFEDLFDQKNVVGLDVVELKPDRINIHSDFWAAKMIYKMIGLKFHPEG